MSSGCTEFIMECGLDLCRCPECKGFLPRDFPIGKLFYCNKCGAPLETMPSHVEDPDMEEDTDYEFGGRICFVPGVAFKIIPKHLRPNRLVKRKTDQWAMGVGFSRRIWEDGDGKFIEIGFERLRLSDGRILQIAQDTQGRAE